MVNGEVYEGIGNYDATNFTYQVVRDPGTFVSGFISGADKIRNFVLSSATMTPKYLKRKTKSNTLELTTIQKGDVLDFGPFPQSVPSIFKEWIDNNCTETTGASEPVNIEITSPGGVHLYTEGKTCSWDIKAVPKLQTKSVTQTETKQIFVADDGYAGIKELEVTVLTPANIDTPAEDSPLPIPVSSESAMITLLDTSEIGSVYKYTGETTNTFENGALYIVEESE
jgi:hypothetical protein